MLVPEVCGFSGGKTGEEVGLVGLVGMLVQSQNHILREQRLRRYSVDRQIYTGLQIDTRPAERSNKHLGGLKVGKR